MYERCTACNRTFYVQEYPPRLCPICEEEAIRRVEAKVLLAPRKPLPAVPERRI
jgi:predicted RNA-binding Zn-ribbon protein involved in translation (DUF1610 family)